MVGTTIKWVMISLKQTYLVFMDKYFGQSSNQCQSMNKFCI